MGSKHQFIRRCNSVYFPSGSRIDVFEALRTRRSVRAYEETPVPRKALKLILEAGRVSPSASNGQPWHFIVVTDIEKRKVISKGPYAKFVIESPL